MGRFARPTFLRRYCQEVADGKNARRRQSLLWSCSASLRSAAAGAVLGARPSSLQTLVAKSLLQEVGDQRYELHDLLKQFLEEKQDRPLPAAGARAGPPLRPNRRRSMHESFGSIGPCTRRFSRKET